MAVQTVYMRVGDLLDTLDVTLRDEDGVALDCTAASGITFSMTNLDTGNPKIVEVAAAFISAAAGTARYTWVAGDTDTEGRYDCRFKVTTSSKIQSVPSREDQLILVLGRD